MARKRALETTQLTTESNTPPIIKTASWNFTTVTSERTGSRPSATILGPGAIDSFRGLLPP
jgi:hypothetical protein